MRLVEFDQVPADEPDVRVENIASLLTVLNSIIAQAENEQVEPSVATSALINMVTNTGAVFDYNALIDAYESNAAVNNLIKNYSKETVDLVGSASDEMGDQTGNGEDSGEAVARIAKRVAQRNI